MTLWPDSPLATTRMSGESYFCQQSWPGQACSDQNRLSQATPSRAIAELLLAAGRTESMPRAYKGRALSVTIIGRRIRVERPTSQ